MNAASKERERATLLRVRALFQSFPQESSSHMGRLSGVAVWMLNQAALASSGSGNFSTLLPLRCPLLPFIAGRIAGVSDDAEAIEDSGAGRLATSDTTAAVRAPKTTPKDRLCR